MRAEVRGQRRTERITTPPFGPPFREGAFRFTSYSHSNFSRACAGRVIKIEEHDFDPSRGIASIAGFPNAAGCATHRRHFPEARGMTPIH